jgi:hypothetical protein
MGDHGRNSNNKPDLPPSPRPTAPIPSTPVSTKEAAPGFEEGFSTDEQTLQNLHLEEGPEVPIEIIDPDAVDWDGPDDPENPMNWADKKKWSCIAVLAIMSILT